MDPSLSPWHILIAGLISVIGTVIVGKLASGAQAKQAEVSSTIAREGYAWEAMKAIASARDAMIADLVRENEQLEKKIAQMEEKIERLETRRQSGSFSRELIEEARREREEPGEAGWQSRRAATSPVLYGPLHGVHALVVEDQAPVRELVRAQLEDEGAMVSEASSAREALAACLALRFHVIISDLRMDDAAGLEILRRLRQDEDTRPHRRRTPIILLTASDLSEQFTRDALAAGAQAVLGKPYDKTDLIATVLRLVGRPPLGGEGGEKT